MLCFVARLFFWLNPRSWVSMLSSFVSLGCLIICANIFMVPSCFCIQVQLSSFRRRSFIDISVARQMESLPHLHSGRFVVSSPSCKPVQFWLSRCLRRQTHSTHQEIHLTHSEKCGFSSEDTIGVGLKGPGASNDKTFFVVFPFDYKLHKSLETA